MSEFTSLEAVRYFIENLRDAFKNKLGWGGVQGQAKGSS